MARGPSLNIQIGIGAIGGLLFGLVLNRQDPSSVFYQASLYWCDLIGRDIFIGLLKMILIPLVFTSITVGIANLRAHARMGLVWKTTLVYFLSTTALSVVLGLIAVNLFHPGQGLSTKLFSHQMTAPTLQNMTLGEFFKTFVSGLFLNPFAAMADGKVLPTVVFALFLGIGLIITGEKTTTLLSLLRDFLRLVMLMVNGIMKLAPLGIFALISVLVATQDIRLLAALGGFIAVVCGATLTHGLITLPLILKGVAKESPRRFFKGVQEALLTAYSTSSSSATLPVTMRCLEDNLRVDKDIAGFVLPLGATINMDGTALYEAVAALFIANLMGIDLNLIQQITVFFMAIVAAIGAPGIPSAGMVTMVMVLQSVGLPAEAVGILLPIDRFLDALRTTVNVEGDAVGCLVVQRFTQDTTK